MGHFLPGGAAVCTCFSRATENGCGKIEAETKFSEAVKGSKKMNKIVSDGKDDWVLFKWDSCF